jgi:integrase
MSIYLRESDAGDRRKFTGDVLHVFNRFVRVIGDLPLSELRYVHACQFRDYLLSLDLKPVTVRKQTAILNAMLNMAFRYLDMDRMSPFRALKISGEGTTRPMRVITRDLLLQVKAKLMTRFKPYKFIGLLQMNTGLRLSEPVYARVEDCVLDHEIPQKMSSLTEKQKAVFELFRW